MVWHELFPAHKHGCREEGNNLKTSAKKAVLLVSSGKKQISPLSSPLKKLLEKSTSAPPGKDPSDVHAHKHAKLHCKKLCCVAPSGNTIQQHQCGKQAVAGRQTVHGVFCQTLRNPVKFTAKLQIIYYK